MISKNGGGGCRGGTIRKKNVDRDGENRLKRDF